jgi:hypothetical protein
MLASYVRCGEDMSMRFELGAARHLGLQHVLENGIFILDGADVSDERRQRVVQTLLSVVSRADQGAIALVSHKLNFAPEERSAIESFSLFYRYLGSVAEDLPSQLSSAREALQELGEEKEVAPLARQSLRALLASLLHAIELDRAMTPLAAPRAIHY